MTTWQKKVLEFEQLAGHQTTVENRLIDLSSEVGELAKEVLIGNDYGQKSFAKTADWEMELGDCLFSLCSLANLTDCDLEQALAKVLHKYTDRLVKKGHAGSMPG